MSFEAIGSEVRFEGAMIKAGIERYRYDDGAEVSRDKVWHPGAAGRSRRRRAIGLADPPAARDGRRPGLAGDSSRQAGRRGRVAPSNRQA